MLDKKKILLLGGTGAMGVHLVNILSSKAVEVTVTSRHYKKSEGNIEYVRGNAQDITFIQKLLNERWYAIVDFMVYPAQIFKERVDMFLESTEQYIFISSSRVYADSKDPITEESPRLVDFSQDSKFLSTDEYSLKKAREEDTLKKHKKTNWTIIRPYITYSEIRLQLGVLEKEDWLYRALQGRTIVFTQEIASKVTTLTYGFDVAMGIASIIGDNKALGEVFHITNNQNITWNEVLELYLDVIEERIGRRPNVFLQDLQGFNKTHGAIYQIKYDRLYDRVFDNSKISKYINPNNFLDTKIGIDKCLNLFLDNPSFNAINWVNEAKKDRLTKEFASFREIKGIKQRIKYFLCRFIIKK